MDLLVSRLTLLPTVRDKWYLSVLIDSLLVRDRQELVTLCFILPIVSNV